jgi:hypothetical protein
VVIETDALELYQSDGPAEHCVGAYKHVDWKLYMELAVKLLMMNLYVKSDYLAKQSVCKVKKLFRWISYIELLSNKGFATSSTSCRIENVDDLLSECVKLKNNK